MVFGTQDSNFGNQVEGEGVLLFVNTKHTPGEGIKQRSQARQRQYSGYSRKVHEGDRLDLRFTQKITHKKGQPEVVKSQTEL